MFAPKMAITLTFVLLHPRVTDSALSTACKAAWTALHESAPQCFRQGCVAGTCEHIGVHGTPPPPPALTSNPCQFVGGSTCGVRTFSACTGLSGCGLEQVTLPNGHVVNVCGGANKAACESTTDDQDCQWKNATGSNLASCTVPPQPPLPPPVNSTFCLAVPGCEFTNKPPVGPKCGSSEGTQPHCLGCMYDAVAAALSVVSLVSGVHLPTWLPGKSRPHLRGVRRRRGPMGAASEGACEPIQVRLGLPRRAGRGCWAGAVAHT